LLEDIDELSSQYSVEACIITEGSHDTRPTIWAFPAMTEKLLKANIEAKLDHLLKEKKRLGDEFNKRKQELTEKLKEKKGLEEESIYPKQELAEK
jgi:hypothetical protein